MQTNVTVPHAVEGDIPTLAHVRELSQFTGPCVSIYLAGHQAGSGSGPWSVRLRRMIEEIDSELKNRWVTPSDRADLLDPLRALLADPEIGKGHHGGLAVFRSPRAFSMLRLPWEPVEGYFVEQRFMIMPLVAALDGRERFFLLNLALHSVELKESLYGECQAVPLPAGTPTHLDEFMAYDVEDHRLANLSTAGPGVGATTGIFGTKTLAEKRHLHLHDYCRAIDRALHPLLIAKGIPLVVAGAEAEVTAYLAVNTYPNCVDKMLAVGQHSGWTQTEVVDGACALLHQWTSEVEKKALVDYHRLANLRRTSTELESILRSAWHGRVWHFFVIDGDRPKGDIDRMLGRVPETGEMAPALEDLLNATVVETLRHRGNVWMLPTLAMPDKTQFAAALRF